MEWTESLPCGICAVIPNEELTIAWANGKAYEMLGYTPQLAQREGIKTAAQLIPSRELPLVRDAIQRSYKKEIEEFEYEIKVYNKDRELVWLLLRCRFLSGGEPMIICAMMDITGRKEKEREQNIREQELGRALEQSGQFLARYHLKERSLYLTERAADFFRAPRVCSNMPEIVPGKGYVEGEDLEKYMDFFRRMQDGVLSGSTTLQMRIPPDRQVWIRVRYTLVYGYEENERTGFVTFEDVTKQRQREISYQQWYRLFERQVMDSMLYYEYNLTRNALVSVKGRAAPQLPEDFPLTFTEVSEYVAGHLVQEEDRESYLEVFDRKKILDDFYRGKRETHCEYRREVEGRRGIWVDAAIQTMQDLDSDDVKCYVLLRNVDSRKRKELEMAEKSQKDALTGVYNRGMGMELMLQMIQRCPGQPALFYIMDVDDFKNINDFEGHGQGDFILQQLAKELTSLVRKQDVVCRFGGDEFVIFLRYVAQDRDIFQMAQEIGMRINRQIWENCSVTVSIGCAVYPLHGKTLETLYQYADMALYDVKRGGGNNCMIYDEILPRKEEQEIQRIDIKGRYSHIVKEAYDELIECNLTRNTYRRLYYVPRSYMNLPFSGKFDEAVAVISGEKLYPGDRERFLSFLDKEKVRRHFEKGEEKLEGEFRVRFGNEDYGWIAIAVRSPGSRFRDEIWLITIRDIDKQKMAREIEERNRVLLKQQQDAERYQIIIEQSGAIVLDYDFRTGVSYMADGAKQFVFSENVEKGDYRHFIRKEDVFAEDWEKVILMIRDIRGGGSSARATARLQRKDGSYLWCRLDLAARRSADGRLVRIVLMINDVDEAMRDKTSLSYKEEFDELTGCSNYNRFKRETSQILAGASDEKYALWYLNLKNFKLINDLYGHGAGDSLLCFIARTVADSLGQGERFARRSSDHFVVMMECRQDGRLEKWFRELVRAVESFDRIPKGHILLELSAGVYTIGGKEDILNVEEMIERANMAQNSAKESAGSCMRLYTEELRRSLLYEKKVAAEMDLALERRQFMMYLQPIARLEGGKAAICGAEALVRWKLDNGNIRMPGEFIPLFEQSGFIVELDYYMLESACLCLHQNRDALEEGFTICVNISRVTLLQEDFADRCAAYKEKYGVPDGRIILECTETTVVNNTRLLDEIIGQLREKGFVFALDDFGAGYSSLNVLKDVHVDMIKLDRTFLMDGLENERSRIIVSSVISMAGALGMKVLAEGVETQDQLKELAGLQCDLIQGYYLAKPMPAQQFILTFMPGSRPEETV